MITAKPFLNALVLCLLASGVCGEEPWLTEVRQKAEAGDAKAQIKLGDHLRGIRPPVGGEDEAVKWYRRAAEQGDVNGMRNLGRFLGSAFGSSRQKFPDESISWLEKAVLKGDGESCYQLYFQYIGRFRSSRFENSKSLYQTPIPSAEEKAMFDKALTWLSKGVEMNDALCTMENSKLWKNGHVFSEGDLKRLFLNTNKLVGIDEEQAFFMMKKAANLGHGEALHLLGVAYLEGKLVPVDYSESLKFFVKAYDSKTKWYGFPEDLLGNIYIARQKALKSKIDVSLVLSDTKYAEMLERRFKELEGDLRSYESISKDMPSASILKNWFEYNRAAYEALADVYLSGDASLKNEKRAIEIYMRLCEACRYDRSIVPKVARIFLEKPIQGFDPHRLVSVLEDVVSRVKKVYTVGMTDLPIYIGDNEQQEKERDWMTRQECLLILAKIYEGGRGVDADLIKSNQYYLECLLNEAQQRNLVAAQRGDPQAQFRIGYILLDGTEVGAQRSISDSVWRGDFFRTPGFIGWTFKQYCDNGYLRTALKLDYAEQREKRKEAIKWITMAAEQGDLQAQAWLSDIHIHYEDFRNYEQAFRWARKAAVRGNAGALVVLSKLSLEGRGMPKDEVEAYAYINLAASKDESFRGYFTEMESRLPANVRFAGQQRTRQLQKELEDEELQRVLNPDKDKTPKKGA